MILAATLVLGAALSFSSCKSEDVSVDTEKLVADLLAAKVAAVDGEPMSANAVSTIYGCADMAESAVAYGSGGASADQIALFTAKDAEVAKNELGFFASLLLCCSLINCLGALGCLAV